MQVTFLRSLSAAEPVNDNGDNDKQQKRGTENNVSDRICEERLIIFSTSTTARDIRASLGVGIPYATSSYAFFLSIGSRGWSRIIAGLGVGVPYFTSSFAFFLRIRGRGRISADLGVSVPYSTSSFAFFLRIKRSRGRISTGLGVSVP